MDHPGDLSADAVREPATQAFLLAHELLGLNPGYPAPGTDTNCGHVAVTGDLVLAQIAAGRAHDPVCAVRTRDWSTVVISSMFAEIYRRPPRCLRATSWPRAREELDDLLGRAGEGARAVVWGIPSSGHGHVVNAVNAAGTVHLVDLQRGVPADFGPEFSTFFAVRTDGTFAHAVPYMFRPDSTLDPYWEQGEVLLRYRNYWGHPLTVTPGVHRCTTQLQRLRMAAEERRARAEELLQHTRAPAIARAVIPSPRRIRAGRSGGAGGAGAAGNAGGSSPNAGAAVR